MLNKVKYRHNKPGFKFTNIKKIFENLLKIQIPIKKQFTNWQFTQKKFKNSQKIILENKSKSLVFREMKIKTVKTTTFF